MYHELRKRGTSFWLWSNPFERQRDALPAADAQGGKRALAVTLMQAVPRGQRQPRTRHAERMTERNGAAVRIDVLGVIGESELAQHRQRLRGERLVELDQIEIADFQSQPRHQLLSRRHRADA